jgi:hypothetical protein
MHNFFKKIGLFIALVISLVVTVMAQVPGKIKQTGQVLLPNGWKLSPAGRSLPTGDLPLNIQLSSNGKLLAVTNNGQSTQSVQLVRSAKKRKGVG